MSINNNSRTVQANQNRSKNILVISYDENLNDFYESDIRKNQDFVQYILDHKYIVLCTQKSVSASKYHFPHIFKSYIEKYNYEQVYKYDPSNKSTKALTDNYNIRTRIFKKNATTSITVNSKQIENGSFRTYFRNTANKNAVLFTFKINDKTYNIINTDLYSLKVGNKPMYNNGLLYKQQEFLAIIKDFKLYDKYANGEQIILAGSLKFNINPLKMTNILTNGKTKIYEILNILHSKHIYHQINRPDLKQYNELYKYLNKLINNYSKPNIQSTIPNNIKNQYNLEYVKVKNLLDKFKTNLKMNITGSSKHENIRSTAVSLAGSLVKGVIKSVESRSRGNGMINSGKNVNLISARDRILYALKDNLTNDNSISEYKVFKMDPSTKRTNIRGDSRFITLSIN